MKEKPTKTKPKKRRSDWGDCADCSVCMAMKIAEETGKLPTLEELAKAFRGAEKNPKAKVGWEGN